jgi:predicted DCC family thiol-disulfide oxidoreductase YuxK
LDRQLDHTVTARLTVWYDGACPLCIREIALMRRLDKQQRIAFADVAEPSTNCPIDRSLMLARFHATTEQGETLSGAAAFAAMWREIPPLRPLGLMAQNRVVLALLERAYTLFLKVRPLLQRLAR